VFDTARPYQWSKQLNASLESVDPEIFDIVEHEKNRQYKGLQMIPSENFTSQAVLQALGSVMQNKYSEGYPGQRYYGGNEYIDMSERLCQKRALEAFRVSSEKWGVNVQPLSGSPANIYCYSALLKPHDRILSLDLPHGGHLSHGYQTPTKKISAVSTFWETFAYRLNESTGIIDYDKLEEYAQVVRPKLIVCGASAYPRLIDYKRFRAICDKVGAILLVDMAHISGLIAADVIPTPFEYADIVTTTTHKSLRGPRGAMIFFKRGVKSVGKDGKAVEYDFEEKINATVFPGHQGGPHNHTITALAVALKLAKTPEFVEYQTQVLKNSKALADRLTQLGYKLVSNGTDNHLMLVDLRDKEIDGARVEKVLDYASIAVNKNTVPGDKSALVPGGIRMGSPAMTSRGLLESDFAKIGDFVDRAVKIAKQVDSQAAGKKFVDFKAVLDKDTNAFGIKELKADVEALCLKFPVVGFEPSSMKYNPTKQ